ncbi:MAG: phosphoribosylamine--glycine ligase [Candidatus Omnitrophota bacterium]
MKILIIGSGGREHALAWKIASSEKAKKIFILSGNGGTGAVGENLSLGDDSVDKIADFVSKENIDLTVVGPEAPLVAGITDEMQRRNLKIFGPSQKAAMLEGSKVFAKEVMAEYGIPTADFEIFDNADKAIHFIEKKNFQVVIKADGLAAGKGVVVCDTKKEAIEAIEEIMLKKKFGSAGSRVVIEEKLSGQEASILALCDGENVTVLAPSQDHKQIYDGDKGPNTGGMGAYSPTPVVNKEVFDYTVNNIIKKTVSGMRKKGIPYKGILYAGIMITSQGPKTLEFNVRFGDPETQAILPRMKSDLVDLILASSDGNLGGKEIEWENKSCVCVVMAAKGYPGSYEKGREITGIKEAEKLKDVFVFHAGTKNEKGKIITSGGRVMGVSALGENTKSAIARAYEGVSKIKFDGMYFRKDIGFKAI